MIQKKIIIVWLVASLSIIFLSACGSTRGAASTPTPLPPIVNYEKAVYSVEQGPIVSEKNVYGEIVPSKQDELFFRASGYVQRVIVKEGDKVKEGDLLAELQVDDLLNQLEQARIDLEVAQAALDKDQAQRQYTISQDQIDVTIWEKRVELAKLDMQGLWREEDKLRAQLNLDITEQNLALAKLALQQAQEEVSSYEQQAVDRNQLAVQRLEALVAERRVLAPYDCVILKSNIRPGQQIDAYDVVFGVGDPTNLVIRVQYDYELNDKLKKDSEIRVYPGMDDQTSYPVQYLLNFLPISSKSSETSTEITSDWLYFSIPPEIAKDETLVGKPVKLVVVLGRKDNALLLPPAAIRNYRGQYFVIVLDGDRRRRVEIYQIGLQTTDRWEVISEDLKVGDQVLGP